MLLPALTQLQLNANNINENGFNLKPPYALLRGVRYWPREGSYLPTPWLLLKWVPVCSYAMSGTDREVRYAMSGTDIELAPLPAVS
eukprot:1810201-Rhodomonas_salina.1